MQIRHLAVVLLAVVGVACGGGQSAEPIKAGTTAEAMAQKDIIETAQSAGAFNTLLSLLESAELTETFRGAGPYTVFAPTDAAFEKFPADQIAALKKNRDQLRAILSYHVMSGRVLARDVAGMNSATTLAGPAVDIKSSDAGLKINDATVVQPDVAASNGVIHVIDAVLLPPQSP